MAGNPNEGATILSSSPEMIVDLYKLAVEQADRVSGRRSSANSYFLTIHTALATFVGVLSAGVDVEKPNVPRVDDVTLIAVAAVGILLSGVWWLLLRSYRDLNRAKFQVITEIERQHLPLHLFEREWNYLKLTEPLPWWKGRYAELGFVERVVPIAFAAVYTGLAMRVFIA